MFVLSIALRINGYSVTRVRPRSRQVPQNVARNLATGVSPTTG
jgi:hypothetical protein